MEILDLTQGTPEWHAHRARCFNASDAPAMLGLSAYESRGQLIERLATGIRPDVTAGQQFLFDRGHAQEAIARPYAETLAGEVFYPVTGMLHVDGLSRPLSASFDGVSASGDTAFEHKMANAELREALAQGVIPYRYRAQLEQQLLVLGVDGARVLFMASQGAGEHFLQAHAWYETDPELRALLLRGWRLLDEELQQRLQAGPAQVVDDVRPIGRSMDQLPALRVEVTGTVTASNLGDFRAAAMTALRSVNVDLQTDQDFADAAQAVAWCEGVEQRLQDAKRAALSQTADLDQLFRTMDELTAESARIRRHLTTAISSRRDAIKREACEAAQAELLAHCNRARKALEAELQLPVGPLVVAADFASAAKNRRSVATLRDAIATELARAKGEAMRLADCARTNAQALRESGLALVVVPDIAGKITADPEQFLMYLGARTAQVLRSVQAPAVAPAPAWTEVPPLPTVAPTPPDPLASVLMPRAPLPASVQPSAAAAEKIRVRHVCEALGFTVTVEQLRQFGIEPVSTAAGGAVFYTKASLPDMLETIGRAIIQRAAELRQES